MRDKRGFQTENEALADGRIPAVRTAVAASSARRNRPFLAVTVGAVVVGSLDLFYAIIVYSPHHPILVPQTIASGVLGARSYNGGLPTAALGLFLHFTIAFGAAITYYLASRRLKLLVHHAVAWGLFYGAAVYLFMHLIVLPLSAVPRGDTPFIYQAFEFVEHLFCVGLPIALSVRRYST